VVVLGSAFLFNLGQGVLHSTFRYAGQARAGPTRRAGYDGQDAVKRPGSKGMGVRETDTCGRREPQRGVPGAILGTAPQHKWRTRADNSAPTPRGSLVTHYPGDAEAGAGGIIAKLVQLGADRCLPLKTHRRASLPMACLKHTWQRSARERPALLPITTCTTERCG
jgi:hypothetical protein